MSVDPSTEVDAEAGVDTDIETSGDTDISTANTMRERADESWLKLWVILKANRLYIAGVLALTVFFTLVGVGTLIGVAENLNSGDTKGNIFSTLLAAIITGTTLIVTITQLVISQENGPLGDQHERMSNTMGVREYAGDLYDGPTPVDPSALLRQLVMETERRAEMLRESVADSSDDDLRAEVDEFTESLIGNAEVVTDRLEGTTFGSFEVVFAALDFNYGWKIFQVERIGHEHADAIDTDTEHLLSELRTALTMYGPVREHVKTLYFEWALVDLSQLILYTALPALLTAGSMLTFFGSGPIPGTTLGVANVLWIVAAAFTVSVLPFLILVSYIVRIATVAKRTLAIGPLILRESQR